MGRKIKQTTVGFCLYRHCSHLLCRKNHSKQAKWSSFCFLYRHCSLIMCHKIKVKVEDSLFDELTSKCNDYITELKLIFPGSCAFTYRMDEVRWRRFGTPHQYHLQRSSETNNIMTFVSLDLSRWNRPGVPKLRQRTSSIRHVKTQKPRSSLLFGSQWKLEDTESKFPLVLRNTVTKKKKKKK